MVLVTTDLESRLSRAETQLGQREQRNKRKWERRVQREAQRKQDRADRKKHAELRLFQRRAFFVKLWLMTAIRAKGVVSGTYLGYRGEENLPLLSVTDRRSGKFVAQVTYQPFTRTPMHHGAYYTYPALKLVCQHGEVCFFPFRTIHGFQRCISWVRKHGCCYLDEKKMVAK